MHVDHWWPVSRGGTSEDWNLVSACRDCNMAKGDSPPKDATLGCWVVKSWKVNFDDADLIDVYLNFKCVDTNFARDEDCEMANVYFDSFEVMFHPSNKIAKITGYPSRFVDLCPSFVPSYFCSFSSESEAIYSRPMTEGETGDYIAMITDSFPMERRVELARMLFLGSSFLRSTAPSENDVLILPTRMVG